jgi:hypothetical protein
VTDWMTIRVVLTRQADAELPQPAGRVLLAHADHSFSDLAEAIDTAFGRWDLTPLHQFEVEGRVLLSDADDPEAEETEDVTLGEVGLRGGARFTYLFDLGEGWTHECTVEDIGVDPFDLAGEEPDVPVPVFGWGLLPDQYGRLAEDDEDVGTDVWADTAEALEDVGEEEPFEDQVEDWDAAETASWDVVASAIGDLERSPDTEALAAVTASLRAAGDDGDWPAAVLWAAADVDRANPPDDDEELWVLLAAGVVAPRGDVPLDADRARAWAALEAADWAGAVIELVRAGPGTSVTPEAVLERIAACPEVEEDELSDEGRATVIAGLDVVIELWRGLGVVGADGRLTQLGHWGLPEALAEAWASEDED